MVYIGFYGRLFFQELFTDNTKMPTNRLLARPLWWTITVNNIMRYGKSTRINGNWGPNLGIGTEKIIKLLRCVNTPNACMR